eukprot:Protomagalhaensia_wolfi_Nauph_80__1313@NODE_1785_length_1340_cov_52_641045_g1390_i0_p1_GENE_NODE_1785_length_1340_cov_52_641045_g1390_i0NODE_1785_length_1340_cov_52_641045_g1390_i0_p1_ORF_typecomplete_len387_score78_84FTA4/PF13093_6/0_038Com_YlbF/PF06133_11/40Com_YlbF/PF06133_11/21_NODE_1785_length_1340_cov_52_641045_g1390_i0391199
MDAEPFKLSILTTVVQHVKTQYDILKNATNEVPGFHEGILPKFTAYVNQLEQTASKLQRQYDLDLFDGFLIQLKDSIVNEINSFEENSDMIPEISEFQKDVHSIQYQQLSAFLTDLQERSRSKEESVAQYANYLEVLERHLPLVRLEKALKQNLNDENVIRNRAEKQNVEKLLQEVAAIVNASGCDVRAANSRVCIEAVNLPSMGSPPSFKDSTPPGKNKDSNEPVVPPLWITANLPSTAVRPPPPPDQKPNNKEAFKKPKIPQRVTLDHRPIPPNAFDSDDEVSHQNRVDYQAKSNVTNRGRQIFQPRHDLASQLTFRPQQQHQLASPRFGGPPAVIPPPGNQPGGQQGNQPGGQRRAVSHAKEKRLSLGSKMLNRRSASCYAWD